jgi:hypothetical protein
MKPGGQPLAVGYARAYACPAAYDGVFLGTSKLERVELRNAGPKAAETAKIASHARRTARGRATSSG